MIKTNYGCQKMPKDGLSTRKSDNALETNEEKLLLKFKKL